MLSSLAISYDIGANAHEETMSSTHVSESPSVSGCGTMTYSFTNENGTAVDSAVFTYSSSDTQLTVYSTDATKAGVYDLTLKAVYDGFTNYGELDFQVILIDLCETTTLTIANSMLSSLAISYNVSSTATVETLDSVYVTSSPSIHSCPEVVFSFDDQNGDPLDGDVFTYDSSSQQFSIETSDSSKAASYDIRLRATYNGYTNFGNLNF